MHYQHNGDTDGKLEMLGFVAEELHTGISADDIFSLKGRQKLLGFFKKNAIEYVEWFGAKNAEDIPAEVKAIAEERWTARTNRDWAKSDELRTKLADMGYAVKDSKTGYELTKM